ncbi:unnamed protein product [Schistocephalus solidus]|uniref:Reverse transcriptase domain-containing protein n=1 Tax=Schistocephalus solidus TaxID=70667 RepID=A0A183T4M7_SCHSO|nr:unnamed protein product [Schistocephalus solidus]
MLLWSSLTGTQLSPVAPRSCFFPAATPRDTATTGGLNQVRVSGVVCVFTPGKSALFPCSYPLPSSLPFLLSFSHPTPLSLPTSPPAPPLSSSYSCFHPSSSPSFLTLNSFPTVEKSYGEGNMQSPTIHELLFADDCALNATTEEEIQRSMDLFAAACDNFGLRSNTEKTVVMHEPSPNTLHRSSH